jgi:uncharacterized protein (DUF885 family)
MRLTNSPFRTFLIRSTSIGLASVMLAACGHQAARPGPSAQPLPSASQGASHRSIEAIGDEYLAALLKVQPELGTLYSLPQARHDRLRDNSMTALAAWEAREDQWLRELEAIGKPDVVASRDWVTYGILHETLESAVASRICRNELWQASANTDWHNNVPFLFEIQPVDTPELQQQALRRLKALEPFIDTEILNLRAGLDAGYSAPRVTVVPAINEIRALLDANSPLLSPAVRAGSEAFSQQVNAVFVEVLTPAIQRYIRLIEDEYLPRAREEIALSHNPGGASCYPALVRSYSTLQIDAGEIHRIGLQQIAAIRREMQAIIDRHFPGESIESFLRNMGSKPEFTFQTEDEVLQYSVDALELARQAMPRAFGRLPRADVRIVPYPPYRASSTGEYQSSSEDGTRPGIYYIAVVNPERRSRGIQQSVLFHETYPGHHLQGAIALELGDRVHPIARYLWNSGYGEGWGLYAERLADELGLYAGPLDRMGMLSDQAARAARLVIDSGIHTQGWSRQQSVDYMLANTAWPEVDIQSEINRYISWPGQANAYMLGMLEILRLRNLAESALDENFDLRAFHDRLLEYGSIPLPMLDESIHAWINEQSQ